MTQIPPDNHVTSKEEVAEILDLEHHFLGGLYAKRIALKRGESFGKHIHDFDHVSIVAKGVARVEMGDEVRVYGEGCHVEIKAGIQHSVFAMTDLVWFCIHVTNETDPEKIDEATTHG